MDRKFVVERKKAAAYGPRPFSDLYASYRSEGLGPLPWVQERAFQLGVPRGLAHFFGAIDWIINTSTAAEKMCLTPSTPRLDYQHQHRRRKNVPDPLDLRWSLECAQEVQSFTVCSPEEFAMEGLHETQELMLDNTLQQLMNDVFVWIGFGTVVGLLAKGVMPGRDPGGAIATVLMGIGGTVIGCGVVSYFRQAERIVPLSPLGMFVGVAGTLLILFFYKLLGGYYFVEGEYVTRAHRRRGWGRRRRYSTGAWGRD